MLLIGKIRCLGCRDQWWHGENAPLRSPHNMCLPLLGLMAPRPIHLNLRCKPTAAGWPPPNTFGLLQRYCNNLELVCIGMLDKAQSVALQPRTANVCSTMCAEGGGTYMLCSLPLGFGGLLE